MSADFADRARQLFEKRGLKVRLESDRAVKARRLGLVSQDEDRTVSVKILYAGAAQNHQTALHPQDDPYPYTHLFIPFPDQPQPYTCWDLFRDADGALWGNYLSQVYLKDPAIYESGLKLVFEVPEILAVKKPAIRVSVNDDVVRSETVETAGIHTWTLDIRGTDAALIRYMDGIRRQQRILLGEFIRVCEKYGLTWYLICGGLIGCMRDGGLLPWDDDLDVAMPRRDYDLFCAAAKREWPPGADCLLLKPDEVGENCFLDYMTRLLYMRETTEGDAFARLGEKGRKDIRFHLPMDIYVLDGASRFAWLHRLRSRKWELIYALALAHRGHFETENRADYGKKTVAAVKLLHKLGRRIPVRLLLKRWSKSARRVSAEKTGWVCQSNGYYRCLRDRYPVGWFGSGREVSMEGLRVRIPAEADRFLRKMYGNYMEYGQIWDRRPMHRNDRIF